MQAPKLEGLGTAILIVIFLIWLFSTGSGYLFGSFFNPDFWETKEKCEAELKRDENCIAVFIPEKDA